MMRFAAGLVGLLVGLALGVALLALNPVALMQPQALMPAGSPRILGWETGEDRGLPLTSPALLGLGAEAPRRFADPGIAHARAEVAAVPGAGADAGPVLLVRLSALSRDNSLLRARLGIVTYSNVLWPEQGSVFLIGSENLWALLRDTLWSAARGGGFQLDRPQYPLPPMPGAGVAEIVGAAGAHQGARGSYRETLVPLTGGRADFAARREIRLGFE